jgi:hypothetical protein
MASSACAPFARFDGCPAANFVVVVVIVSVLTGEEVRFVEARVDGGPTGMTEECLDGESSDKVSGSLPCAWGGGVDEREGRSSGALTCFEGRSVEDDGCDTAILEFLQREYILHGDPTVEKVDVPWLIIRLRNIVDAASVRSRSGRFGNKSATAGASSRLYKCVLVV